MNATVILAFYYIKFAKQKKFFARSALLSYWGSKWSAIIQTVATHVLAQFWII